MEGKDAKCILRRHKADKHDRHGKQNTRKQANKREDKQARKQTKGGVHKEQM